MTTHALYVTAAYAITVVVLAGLSRGPVRHGELAGLIGGVSRKVLTQTLRRLESHGLVRRHAYAEVPPRVEYELTEFGRTVEPILIGMRDWGECYKRRLGAPAGPCEQRKRSA